MQSGRRIAHRVLGCTERTPTPSGLLVSDSSRVLVAARRPTDGPAQEGYLHYAGRADDVIIGWTISPLEVERTLLLHPTVSEAAVVGIPGPGRGQIVKAYVLAAHGADDRLAASLQQRIRDELSLHEYPREVES